MATTINPAVSGVSYKRWSYHVALYTAGVAAGALVSYAVAYGLYSAVTFALPTWTWLVATSPLLALVVLRDLGKRVRVPYPERTQVPEWLRHMLPPGLVALVYGGELGVGFLTRFTYSTHLAFVVALPLIGSLRTVAALALVFALGKSIVVVTSLGGRSYGEFERRILVRHTTRITEQNILRIANAAVTTAGTVAFAAALIGY
jgi:hypothetical protein